MIFSIYITVIGILIIVFGLLDGYKYHILSKKITHAKSSKTHSRMVTNITLGKDVVIILYLLSNPDAYLIIMTLIGFIFTIEYGWCIYVFYPYNNRGRKNFKKPNIIKYIWNSLLPNSKRIKL